MYNASLNRPINHATQAYLIHLEIRFWAVVVVGSKGSGVIMSSGTYLPEEILVDILSRLPVKSLCRFKCVSIPWHSLITDPRFVKTHLNRNNRCEKIIVNSDSLYSVDCTEASNNHDVTATKLDMPSNIHCTYILGSCNGLILVADKDQLPKFLLNPSTREFKELPKFSIEPIHYRFRMYGFGYDSSTDEYKVVLVWFSWCCSYTHISFYTWRTDSWAFRYVHDFPYEPRVLFSVGVHVNGSLHWLADKCSKDSPSVKLYVICAFDLTREEFRDLVVPCPSHEPSGLGVLGGCLAMLVCDVGHTNVWVMKEYGVTDTWTKFLTINLRSYCRKNDFISMVDGVVLLDTNGMELVAYNSEEGESRYVSVHGIPLIKHRAKKTYVESLISPHYERYKGIENSRKR
ncbi:F-box/kelch-repeat protein At3g06240-like [Cornus florida]|uniref:F-box/kelch-repeat protein At3g06240-like n=1 Tax=Cornus florida TaxID=4283 RepID=UPI002896C8FA|nr:F-box/kelch-repeat protein At3g06240-like [Cornus florida]